MPVELAFDTSWQAPERPARADSPDSFDALGESRVHRRHTRRGAGRAQWTDLPAHRIPAPAFGLCRAGTARNASVAQNSVSPTPPAG
jgi:hypothetical protein